MLLDRFHGHEQILRDLPVCLAADRAAGHPKLTRGQRLDAGVSSPVRAKFAGALRAWHSAQEAWIDDARYISRFASMAQALTHPEEVLQALNQQAVREL